VPRSPESVHLWGDTLSLNYANTVDWSATDEHVRPDDSDVLRTGELLVRWGQRLTQLGDEPQSVSAAELRRARELRDAVHRIFSETSRLHEPAEGDLTTLLTTYGEAARSASLLAQNGAYELAWPQDGPRQIRFAVALDAMALLHDRTRLRRVTRCPGRGCGWLFLNLSGRRRWCSMSTCGSREKMRRLHERRTQRIPSPED
jgi:predicted RNA-binding Zn ribbon-like protein